MLKFLVFVLQNDPLNLQNEDRLKNTTKVFTFNQDGKKSLCFLKQAKGNNYCTAWTTQCSFGICLFCRITLSICILKSIFVLQIEGVILENEDIFLMNIVQSVSAIIVSMWLS